MTSAAFPEFIPHRLLRGGHAQTLAGAFLPWKRVDEQAARHRVELPDGDALVLHDDCPDSWRAGDRAVLLMHGLAGDYRSGYMVRIGRRLVERGVRTFRLDLRGCGAGTGLARRPYHAGRSDDVRQVVEFIARLCPASELAVVGFSLSGNVTLKFLGEAPGRVPDCVARAMVVNPPIDLRGCVAALGRLSNRLYDRHFVSLLRKSVQRLRQAVPDVEIPGGYGRPRKLYDFDDQYTAPFAGFKDAEEYYARSSAAQFVGGIDIPTLILTARDDPLVPVATFEQLSYPDPVVLHVAEGGGHLGYVARRNDDPDRRWMDWRVVEWVMAGLVARNEAQNDRATPIDS